MEWQLALLLIVGGVLVLMTTGLPVAFAFLLVSLLGAIFFLGGEAGLRQLVLSMINSVTLYALVPLPMFILMGDVMFHSGIGFKMLDVVDKWLGGLPGRLGLLAVAGGTIFATLSGSGMASCALLGTVLTPEMEKRGYGKAMSIGPILGSAGLAIMIPPTGLGVLLASLGQISVGRLLLAIIVPGFLMATLFATYIILRCALQPGIAPKFEVVRIPLSEKIALSVRYLLPLTLVIFAVTGVIFFGIASPSEAAALGALAAFVLAACYKKLNRTVVRKSVMGTVRTTAMVFMILTAASAFGQLLAYTKATPGLVALTTGVPIAPIGIVIIMQVILLIMGCFMNTEAIMMVTLPIYMPIVKALGVDPVWFGAIMLLNMEMATISPPFGLTLFVMKGVAPRDTTMGDIYRAAVPFLGLDLVVMALMIFFPAVVMFLPSLMR